MGVSEVPLHIIRLTSVRRPSNISHMIRIYTVAHSIIPESPFKSVLHEVGLSWSQPTMLGWTNYEGMWNTLSPTEYQVTRCPDLYEKMSNTPGNGKTNPQVLINCRDDMLLGQKLVNWLPIISSTLCNVIVVSLNGMWNELVSGFCLSTNVDKRTLCHTGICMIVDEPVHSNSHLSN